MNNDTPHVVPDGFLVSYLNEVVRYHSRFVTRFVAMKIEKELYDDLEGFLEIGCLPALKPEDYDGPVLSNEEAFEFLRSSLLDFHVFN